MARSIAILLEIGAKRTFATALDWPGWCRPGRDPDEALAALLAHGDRYARIVPRSERFTSPTDTSDFDVTGRLPGNATTDFGAPGAIGPPDDEPLTGEELDRQIRLLTTIWRAFERSVAAAGTTALRTGPRGGGRNVPKMTAHVVDAEHSYLAKLGARSTTKAIPDLVLDAVAALTAIARGDEPVNPSRVTKRWPPRYYVRRAAWHVLDHAWEIEDRLPPERPINRPRARG